VRAGEDRRIQRGERGDDDEDSGEARTVGAERQADHIGREGLRARHPVDAERGEEGPVHEHVDRGHQRQAPHQRA